MALLKTVDYFQLPIAHGRFSWGSRFGLVDAWHPSGHRGTDMMAPAGTPVVASAHGVVRHVGWSCCLGWNVVTEHKLRDPGKPHVFIGNNHLRVRPRVKVGQAVRRGQVIAEVGTTGACTTGNHDHVTVGFSVNANAWERTIDPRDFIESHDTPAEPKPAKTPLGRLYATVREGDTLAKIAARQGYSSIAPVLKLNPGITDPDTITIGQKVRVR